MLAVRSNSKVAETPECQVFRASAIDDSGELGRCVSSSISSVIDSQTGDSPAGEDCPAIPVGENRSWSKRGPWIGMR